MHTEETSIKLRLVVTALHKALRKQGTQASSYSMTELETIGYIYRNGAMLPSDLAASTRISAPSMSQILKKMEEQKIIERTPSTTDRRKVYVSMTASGRDMVESSRYSKDEYLRGLIETKLTVPERELLEKALPVLERLIGN